MALERCRAAAEGGGAPQRAHPILMAKIEGLRQSLIAQAAEKRSDFLRRCGEWQASVDPAHIARRKAALQARC